MLNTAPGILSRVWFCLVSSKMSCLISLRRHRWREHWSAKIWSRVIVLWAKLLVVKQGTLAIVRSLEKQHICCITLRWLLLLSSSKCPHVCRPWYCWLIKVIGLLWCFLTWWAIIAPLLCKLRRHNHIKIWPELLGSLWLSLLLWELCLGHKCIELLRVWVLELHEPLLKLHLLLPISFLVLGNELLLSSVVHILGVALSLECKARKHRGFKWRHHPTVRT